ncbi:MAG: GGDEF domain-containing protein [Gemmatimonadaceae bacterium]|nr:GGDEF domain-containing protein [Gemmatimonadaceae bacterium]
MTATPDDQSAMYLTRRVVDPSWVQVLLGQEAQSCQRTDEPDLIVAGALKSRPRLIILDAWSHERDSDVDSAAPSAPDSEWLAKCLDTCRRLKRDAFTGIVPVLMLVPASAFAEAFEAGADEVLREEVDEVEATARARAMLRRSDRDVDVHPSTRLPGAREIAAELARRVASGEKFAACYADLDHFKEFNDRYGYHRGDKVIQLVARLLHDVVKGWCGAEGFVGHIGGDDFLFTIPLAAVSRVCDDVVQVFDELVPWQYSEQDRRVGYFFGKDRRGQLHRVPLMTVSVGVVTNQRRHFTRAIEVSELATEMKSYAKTLPGSVWAVDRRRDEQTPISSPAIPDPRTRVDQRSAGGVA